MKRFLIRIGIFFSIFIIIVILLLILPYSPKINNEMFIEKTKDSLLENVILPRIIFIGGSNIACGLNSQLIKDSLNINPINTSINAGIGLKYMLESPIKSIREGDTIIVIPEYHQFYGDLADGEIVLLPLLFEVSHKFNIIDFNQYIKLSQYIPKYIASKLKFWKDFETDELAKKSINAFNKYGDEYDHWYMPKPASFEKYEINASLNNEAFNLLTAFKTKVENKKAHLYISFPCYAESSFNKCLNQINIIENKFKGLKIETIGSASRYKMNDSLIFDTEYHLTKKGVDLRTELFIEDFKKVRTHNQVDGFTSN